MIAVWVPLLWVGSVTLLLTGCLHPPESPPKVQDPTEQSLQAAVEQAAEEANEWAKKFDDQVFVEQAKIIRHMRFYDPAKETPSQWEYISDNDGDITIEDTYALAQQVHYRYKIKGVGPVTRCEPGGSFSHRADIFVKVESQCRWGLAKDEKPIPTPPQGQMIWATWGPSDFWRSGLFGSRFLNLEIDRGIRNSAETPLERKAIELLRGSPPVAQEKVFRLRASYWVEKRKWCWDLDALVFYLRIESLQKDPPGREGLVNSGLTIVYPHVGYSASPQGEQSTTGAISPAR